MNPSRGDIDFLCEATQLKPERLFGLIEEERTLNILLDSICDREIPDKISQISFPLFSRLITFKGSKHTKYSLDSKVFIADSFQSFLSVQSIHNISASKSVDISQARYIIILLGIFHNIFDRRIMPSPNYYFGLAQRTLLASNQAEVAQNLADWIAILRKINKQNLLGQKVLAQVENRQKLLVK